MTARVVIVGAGPAGACLALALCRSGIPTTLVETNRSFQRQFRGEALMPSGLSALQAMGLLPLLERVPTRSLQGWRVVVNRQELFSVPEPPAGEPGPGCTLVSQPDLLQALVAACQEQPAFQWIQGQGASALLERQGRITGIRLGNGEHLNADLVVGCDGRSSLLRQRAGLELDLQAQPIDVLWMRLHTDAPPPLGERFTTVVGPAGVFSAFASVQGGMQVGWVVAAGEPSPQLAPAEWRTRLASQSPHELAAWLRGEGSDGTPTLEPPARLSVHCGVARRWWRPGLLLLGDAAHPMSPVRAQGINMALRDAWAAAASLTPLLQASAAAERLDQALADLAERRHTEVTALQQLQLQETRRGDALRRQAWLRALVAGAAPVLGPVIAHRWQQQQQKLRHGITVSAAMMDT
jgi:2-polyprenyl-6-methoxyphenol hydroxylase-like FAD-dependent oxidoreductase